MKKDSTLSDFAVVLLGVRNAGNVGSVARAMLNMGLERLWLVAPACDPLCPEAKRMARDAEPLLNTARTAPSLDEALADSHYAVGMTARQGRRRGALLTPRERAPQLIQKAATGEQIALVFGPEDRGLSAEHLALCQEVLTLPTAGFKSLNLAQAVMLVAYELFVAVHGARVPQEPQRATLGSQERLFEDLQQVLLEIGYLDPNNPQHIMLDLRRLFGRAGLTEREVNILRGLVRQIRWATERRQR